MDFAIGPGPQRSFGPVPDIRPDIEGDPHVGLRESVEHTGLAIEKKVAASVVVGCVDKAEGLVQRFDGEGVSVCRNQAKGLRFGKTQHFWFPSLYGSASRASGLIGAAHGFRRLRALERASISGLFRVAKGRDPQPGGQIGSDRW